MATGAIGAALRHQVTRDVGALADASMYLWYEDAAKTDPPADGVFTGMMNLQIRDRDNLPAP